MCNLVFLFYSLTVLLLLGYLLYPFFFLLFFPCLLLFVHTYLGVAVYVERKRWAMPWHRGPGERTENTATSFSGRKEGGCFWSFWSFTGRSGVSPPRLFLLSSSKLVCLLCAILLNFEHKIKGFKSTLMPPGCTSLSWRLLFIVLLNLLVVPRFFPYSHFFLRVFIPVHEQILRRCMCVKDGGSGFKNVILLVCSNLCPILSFF